MGFHLRKSFKIGAVRFNLSNSGIGFSTGIKGLRIGVDGKGRSYIGGGKGILRYRQQISSADKGDAEASSINFDKKEMPDELKYSMTGGLDILLMFITAPVLLFFSLVFIYYAFSAERSAAGVILSLCFILPALLPFLKYKNKKNKLLKNIFTNLKNNELRNAIINLKELKECKYRNLDTAYWISNKIYECYDALSDYEGAYDFLKDNYRVSGHREKFVKCLYKLEKWEDLINYLQVSYDEREREEHPVYYAMLADAFIKQGKPDIALETLLSGPVNKRSMNAEMCAFRYALGECYELTGGRANALKQYQKVYAFDVNYENIQDKINNLKN